MANKYCNLDGRNKISEEYGKITDGFGKVELEMRDTKNDIDGRINNLVITAGTGDPETLDARHSNSQGTFDTLKQRLDSTEAIIALQSEQPVNYTSNTIWFDTKSLSSLQLGDGISIGNAETNNDAPQTDYWFEPVK